jgi:hypothetical protein
MFLGVFAEFERSMIRERVNAGLARAKAKGVQLGRRPVSRKIEARILELRATGIGMLKIARQPAGDWQGRAAAAAAAQGSYAEGGPVRKPLPAATQTAISKSRYSDPVMRANAEALPPTNEGCTSTVDLAALHAACAPPRGERQNQLTSARALGWNAQPI